MEWSQIIRAIIMVIVVVATVAFIALAFSKLGGFMGESFDDQNESYKAFVNENFNKLVENLKTCAAIKNSTCLCKNVFPNLTIFPPEKISIKIKPGVPEGSKSEVTLLFKEQQIKKETIDAFVTIANVKKVYEFYIEPVKKAYPKTDVGGIISSADVYKDYTNRMSIITMKTPKSDIDKLPECK